MIRKPEHAKVSAQAHHCILWGDCLPAAYSKTVLSFLSVAYGRLVHFIQHCSLWVVKERNGLQLSNLDVPESLLRDKDEYEAYWEHYISVKEELVENILQVRHQRGKDQYRCNEHCKYFSMRGDWIISYRDSSLLLSIEFLISEHCLQYFRLLIFA